MKIRKAVANNRRRCFEIDTAKGNLTFPYALTTPTPTPSDRIASVFVDPELGNEALTYVLDSGAEGAVHIDYFLDYNRDPDYLNDMLLHNLTCEALERFERSHLGNRELARRLGTSASQLYRLLDTTYYKKTIRQMLSLLYLLDCEVEFTIRGRADTANRLIAKDALNPAAKKGRGRARPPSAAASRAGRRPRGRG